MSHKPVMTANNRGKLVEALAIELVAIGEAANRKHIRAYLVYTDISTGDELAADFYEVDYAGMVEAFAASFRKWKRKRGI